MASVENDTVARKSKDQGNHECQVLGEGHEAAESQAAWRCCTKNPGHDTFIPATDFSLEHLPEPYRFEAVLGLVRSFSALTVRLTVGHTSRQRPDGYTFSNCRGMKIPRTGSGCVYRVRTGDGPCRCSRCYQSSSPVQKWYKLDVLTACHAVHNSEEARATKAYFFDDDETSMPKGRVKSALGLDVFWSDVTGDTCQMTCATHDRGLFEMLQAHLKQQEGLKEAVYTDMLTVIDNGEHRELKQQEGLKEAVYTDMLTVIDKGEHRPCVVVSHPHAQTKKITVGWVKRRVAGGSETTCLRTGVKILYTADTCPGSSGGLVLYLDNYRHLKGFAVYYLLLHSEGGLNEGLNMSGSLFKKVFL